MGFENQYENLTLNVICFCLRRRILRNSPPMPRHFSEEVKDFILRLLIKDPKKRLGGKNGSDEVKSHAFFEVSVLLYY